MDYTGLLLVYGNVIGIGLDGIKENEHDNIENGRTEKLLPLNLQFFGADDDDQTDDTDQTDDQQDEQGDDDDQSFTKSDVDSAISKAVDKALKNQQKKLEKEKEQAIKDAKKNAVDYAKMTQKEREDAEYNDRLKVLEQKERELNLKQLRTEVEGDLKEEGLPTEFADSLITMEDNEKIKESIESIKKTFGEAVNDAVKEKLRQDAPETGSNRKTNKNLKSKAEMARKSRIIKS